MNQSELSNTPWVFTSRQGDRLFQKLKDGKSQLGDISISITQGIRTGSLDVFFNKITQQFVRNNKLEPSLFKPIFTGRNVKRYSYTPDPEGDLLLFPYHDDFKTPLKIEGYPKVNGYLQSYKRELLERRDSGRLFGETDKKWFEYWDSKPLCFQHPKIVFPDISQSGNFYLDDVGIGYLNTCYGIYLKSGWDYHFILGILNSQITTYVIRLLSPSLRGGYYRFKTNYVAQFPIPMIDLSNPSEKALFDRLVGPVRQMLETRRRISAAKTESETRRLGLVCESLDRQIDEAVYELYGLTEEEIKVVEDKGSVALLSQNIY